MLEVKYENVYRLPATETIISTGDQIVVTKERNGRLDSRVFSDIPEYKFRVYFFK